MFGSIVNREINNKQQKKKKAKNTALNKLKKGYVFTAQELKEKGKAFPYIILS